MEGQSKKGNHCFVLFHIKWVAIGFVQLLYNAKTHAIRVQKNVIKI